MADFKHIGEWRSRDALTVDELKTFARKADLESEAKELAADIRVRVEARIAKRITVPWQVPVLVALAAKATKPSDRCGFLRRARAKLS